MRPAMQYLPTLRVHPPHPRLHPQVQSIRNPPSSIKIVCDIRQQGWDVLLSEKICAGAKVSTAQIAQKPLPLMRWFNCSPGPRGKERFKKADLQHDEIFIYLARFPLDRLSPHPLLGLPWPEQSP